MKKVVIFIALIAFLGSCTEKTLDPISSSLGKPSGVTEVMTEAIPGGVSISYKVPSNEDLLAVKAVYTLSNGQTLEKVSSFYENNLKLEGFFDTNEHEAKLYSINRAQVESDPVTVKFTPLVNPIHDVIESANIISDFGGAQFSWINETKAPLTFELLAQDSTGRMNLMSIFVSQVDTIKRSLRGYKPIPWRFGLLVHDNYGNSSDTIFPSAGLITPLYEEELNKVKMNVMKLSNDASFTNWEGFDSYLIDGDKTTFGHSANNSIPAAFTIDLGCTAKISRVLFFNRLYDASYYGHGNPLLFEVYGRTEAPSTSGDWSEWTKIMDFKQTKPSETPGETATDEDIAWGEAGFECTFPIDLPPMHYLRFKIVSTWTGATYTHPAELEFYGEIQN